jgi:hypothetical protein
VRLSGPGQGRAEQPAAGDGEKLLVRSAVLCVRRAASPPPTRRRSAGESGATATGVIITMRSQTGGCRRVPRCRQL